MINFEILGDYQNTIGLILENFQYEQYKDLEVKGRNVIDIGGSICDTPLYFAASGAKHVYAYEIDEKRQKEAAINLRLNSRLSKRITYRNEGITSAKLNSLIGKIGKCSIKIDCDNAQLERALIKGSKGVQSLI